MKLNNLSRLTALLMAIMMLAMTGAVAEDSGIDIGDVTDEYLSELESTTALIDTLTAAGYCETCAKDVASAGLTEWPLTGYSCLYKHLVDLTPSEAYDMLISYYIANTDEGDALYEAYINSHNNHVYNAQIAGSSDYPAVICDGCSYCVLQPGAEGHNETCPWHDEEYVPSVNVTPDVSTPDALVGVTSVELSMAMTSTDVTYTWQSSATPDVEDSWTALTGASGIPYTLSMTPAALASAYRCVVTDSTGAVVSTSSVLYLGGEAFFTWATTAEDVQTWLTDSTTYAHVTMDYVLVAYNAYSQTVSIPLSEVIHLIAVMTDDISTTYLIELHGGTTLATMDENNQLIDARYHIAVAQVVDGVVMPLDATTTE